MHDFANLMGHWWLVCAGVRPCAAAVRGASGPAGGVPLLPARQRTPATARSLARVRSPHRRRQKTQGQGPFSAEKNEVFGSDVLAVQAPRPPKKPAERSAERGKPGVVSTKEGKHRSGKLAF